MSPVKVASDRDELRQQIIQNLQRFEELANQSKTSVHNAFCNDWIHIAEPEDCSACALGKRLGGNCFNRKIGRHAAKELAWFLNLSPFEAEVDLMDGQTGEYIRENVIFYGQWLKELDLGEV